MAKKATVVTEGTEQAAATSKQRKPKSPARWAVLRESLDTHEYALAIDNQPGERAAKLQAEHENITGHILIVCIHGEADAVQVNQVQFNWAK